jgi:hypothetical protein
MNKHYICHRCLFETNKRSNIIRHFQRKKKCIMSKYCSHSEKDIIILNEKQLESKNKHKFKDIDYQINISSDDDEESIVYIPNHTINITINNDLLSLNEKWDLSNIKDLDDLINEIKKNIYNTSSKIMNNK